MPQRRINTDDLPSPGDKLAMLQASIEQLSAAGYRYIGMDHFRPARRRTGQRPGRWQPAA